MYRQRHQALPVQPGCQKTLMYRPKALVCKIIVLISASFGTYTRSLSLSGHRKWPQKKNYVNELNEMLKSSMIDGVFIDFMGCLQMGPFLRQCEPLSDVRII